MSSSHLCAFESFMNGFEELENESRFRDLNRVLPLRD